MRTVPRLAAALALAAAVGTTLAAPASAAPARTPLHPVTFTTKLTRTTDGLTDIIYCGGYLTNPAQSSGAVRVDAHVECTAPVDNIYLSAALYLTNGGNIAERVDNFPNAQSADRFAVYGCPGVALSYYATGVAVFTKAGYGNSPLRLVAQSPNVTVSC
ncbi:hypothetical protein [Actinokineospora enzanensis]|uniref:hypothetical protein n=1 Tax=Actinokineospora enzanensis TaxID=155975 RepID=UPI00037996F8|nr:hypothetical protein [Actinokineospora enzanensis]